MNSFLELHSSADYRVTNRPYYTGTWEYINVASDYLIPFQCTLTASDFRIYSIDADGSETDITKYFGSANLITDWNISGNGLVDTGATINSWSVDASEYVYTDNFSLTAGDYTYFQIDNSAFPTPSDYTIQLLSGAGSHWQEDLNELSGKRFKVAATRADYNIRITYTGGGTESVSTNTPYFQTSNIINEASGNRWWYDGTVLSGALSGVFRLRIDTTYYSDWCDACGFTGKLKYSLSSSYDYGGIKYDEDYIQWTYKDASVRRAPRSDIEVVGDSRNGQTIIEKTVSAVRYVIKMKVTEAEHEAFVHSIGGTVTIVDATGKTFNAVNLEITDPSWYRGNGIIEVSFNDSNNINIWTRNNSSL